MTPRTFGRSAACLIAVLALLASGTPANGQTLRGYAGANLAIALASHLSIVPDVRYDYGSIGDEINNTLRTSVRVQWRF